MNKYEKQLWDTLEEYKQKEEGHDEVWENTVNAEYIYKSFDFKELGYDDTLHALMPKEEFDSWDKNKKYRDDGVLEMPEVETKRLYLCCKELRGPPIYDTPP